MPRLKLSDELKAAISALSAKEKDKLLFRLLPKESALVDRLTYQLLEDEATQLERREELRDSIIQQLDRAAEDFYSPGYLLLDLRQISGAITRHVKMTRDPYGEIALNFLMLNYALEQLGSRVNAFPPRRSRTLNNYVVKRALKLIKLLAKLHEDYRLDFQDDMRILGRHLQVQTHMMNMSMMHGLNVDWLLDAEIPEAFH